MLACEEHAAALLRAKALPAAVARLAALRPQGGAAADAGDLTAALLAVVRALAPRAGAAQLAFAADAAVAAYFLKQMLLL